MENVSSTATPQEFGPPGSKQHRKSISTGGGRAWSQEEENYLIETRMHKMPYKHIAATLKKTELACRLHYHQLSFGNKRRRRNSSVTSLASYAPSPITPCEGPKCDFSNQQQQHQQQHQQQQPLHSIPPFSSSDRNTHQDLTSRSPRTPIPILPKPIVSRSNAAPRRGLRLITKDIDRYEQKMRPSVDIARLDKIYDSHRLHFWSTIAGAYGCNLSPAALEHAWCKAHRIDASDFPPTPTASPDETSSRPPALGGPFSAVAEYSSGFTAVNSAVPRSAVVAPTAARKGSFAIASLLTEDKEVRSPC
ncbi:MAG: hypothetical protein Q9210_002730 [Variospora velana]